MPILPAEGTLLLLSTMGIPLYSTRQAVQTLFPIDQAKQTRRTINGELIDISLVKFQKYGSKISCTDKNPPAFDSVWPGKVVVVSCIAELGYSAAGAAGRPVVSGSTRSVGGFTFYRPMLTMLVTSSSLEGDEWPHDYPWELDLEEV